MKTKTWVLSRRNLACLLAGIATALTIMPAIAQNAPVSGKHKFSLTGITEESRQNENEGVAATVELSSEDTEGRYSFQDEIWSPGFAVVPHYHKEHAETFYVVSGQVEWTVGGETHVMGAGDLVFIPPNTIHSVKVVGDNKVHMLMLYDPAGIEKGTEREEQYTVEEREDPKIKARLRELNDFHPVE